MPYVRQHKSHTEHCAGELKQAEFRMYRPLVQSLGVMIPLQSRRCSRCKHLPESHNERYHRQWGSPLTKALPPAWMVQASSSALRQHRPHIEGWGPLSPPKYTLSTYILGGDTSPKGGGSLVPTKQYIIDVFFLGRHPSKTVPPPLSALCLALRASRNV